jgi:Holliday junction resolvasome RuvABC endonuclease subunit
VIVLGCDVSSKSTGLAEVADGELTDQAVWTPPKKATRPGELNEYFDALTEWIGDRPVDLAMVEDPKVRRGFKTIRALTQFETITLLVLERRRIPIRRSQPGVARQIVLGLNVTAGKDEVLAAVRDQFPNIKLPPVNQGGGDVADAFVQGLAAPEILRRNG